MSPTPLPPNQAERPWLFRHYSVLKILGVQTEQRDIGINLPSIPVKGKSITLRKKARLIFGITLTGLIGVLYAASSTILLNSLKQAEEQHTHQVVAGVVSSFTQTQDDIKSIYITWAAWDDTYAFVKNGNKNFIEVNFNPETLALAKIDLAVIVQSSGRLLYGTGLSKIHLFQKRYKSTFLPKTDCSNIPIQKVA